MQGALETIRRQWRDQNRPFLSVRIGINTGEMVVGNMGGMGKFDYTVIGDSVNLASRLEGANKQYKTGIMVSQRTYDLVKEKILGRELDLITVKGRSEPLRTYELIQLLHDPLGPELEKFLVRYSEGLQLYRARRWREAREKFEETRTIRPDDYPAQLYIKRATIFETNPPPDDWNGVFVLTTK
jgi:adenylate cyclase